MPVQHLTDTELGELADELTAAVPVLDPDEQRIAVATYRLLAEGDPGHRGPPRRGRRAARRTGRAHPRRVARHLPRRTGRHHRLLGPRPAGTPSVRVPPRRAQAVGVVLLGHPLPSDRARPHRPHRVGRRHNRRASPRRRQPARRGRANRGRPDLIPAPDAPFDQDVIASFCHHVLFFASPESGERWVGDRDDAFLLSLEQGFELGRRVWEAKFGAALVSDVEAA